MVAASRLVQDKDVCLVGLGMPQIAALLAQRTHAPNARLLLEIGVYDPRGSGGAMGVADPRLWDGAAAFGSMVDVLGAMLQGGRISLGLLGTLQVDIGGNLNSTLVHTDGGERRFLGSGGANDIITHARRTVVVMRHEDRKFKEAVDFVTGPGHRIKGSSRGEVGVPGGGPTHIVSDRAVLSVAAQGLDVESVHPGEDLHSVLSAMPMGVSDRQSASDVTPEPTAEELRILRDYLDPHRWYTH